MKEHAEELFGIHAELVEVETCIKQLGEITGDAATHMKDFDLEDMMHYLAISLGMFADRLSVAEEALDGILHADDVVELA